MDTPSFRFSFHGRHAVIPYFQQPKLHLGPITIHAFGVLVATGILLAFRLIRRRAPKVGLDPVLAERLAMRMVIVGFIAAHIVDRLAYFPRDVLVRPWSLLFIWESISSFGGFLGATLVALWFVRSQPDRSLGWRYLDLIAWAFPMAWFFGRSGCAVAFDHPGYATSFFLGQRYSDHVVRHNLGLYEALCIIPLVVAFQWLGRGKPRPPGYFVGLLPLVYAPIRFLLDTLRWDDARYFGFTPGQYGSVLLAAAGFTILYRISRRRSTDTPSSTATAG
jgi:phosphatidylglycerol:prolipoprotein diacylglycerol transferase